MLPFGRLLHTYQGWSYRVDNDVDYDDDHIVQQLDCNLVSLMQIQQQQVVLLRFYHQLLKKKNFPKYMKQL